jgi:hypothetical protein
MKGCVQSIKKHIIIEERINPPKPIENLWQSGNLAICIHSMAPCDINFAGRH